MNVMIQTCTRTGDLTENKAEIWIILVIVYLKNTGCITNLVCKKVLALHAHDS